jgi:AcrR family transcriptional regulator
MARKSAKPAGRNDEAAYHHGDLRKALLEAAGAVLAAGGAGAVGMREIARRAGVSHAAPYRHYASREALLADLARKGFERLNERFAALPAPGEPERRFVEMARAYVRFALDEPQTWRLMFGESLDKRDHPDLMHASGLAFDTLRQVVQGLGVAAPATLESLAAWAMAHGVARLVLDQRIDAHLDAHLDAHVDPDELVVRAAHVFIAGVRPAPDRRRR